MCSATLQCGLSSPSCWLVGLSKPEARSAQTKPHMRSLCADCGGQPVTGYTQTSCTPIPSDHLGVHCSQSGYPRFSYSILLFYYINGACQCFLGHHRERSMMNCHLRAAHQSFLWCSCARTHTRYKIKVHLVAYVKYLLYFLMS